MKKALILLDERLKMYYDHCDYEFVANIHDEFQIECKEKHARTIATYSVGAFPSAGEYYEFGCTITGTSQTGSDWSLTH
jgi:hypothetical protein